MRHPERVYFEELKRQIVVRFRERQLDCPDDLSEWKGKIIESFQDDLQEKVKGRISTRWFYDHLKSDREDKIPRIDILNLLSEYCGCESWESFKEQKKNEGIKEDQPAQSKIGLEGMLRLSKRPVIAIIILTVIVCTAFFAFRPTNVDEFKISFVDSDFGMPIGDKNLEVTLLNTENEGMIFKADSTGSVSVPWVADIFEIAVKADYYEADTFEIVTGNKNGEDLSLKVDDYSMLIHQMSVSSDEDWERRRAQLDEIISDDAVIILVTQDNQGIEMYNKEEFIDMMTMPINALDNIRILQTEYYYEKISRMRITQEETDE